MLLMLGFCLLHTGSCVYNCSQSAVISSLTISPAGELLIADTDSDGGLLSVSLGTGKIEKLLRNNSDHCTQIHGIGFLRTEHFFSLTLERSS